MLSPDAPELSSMSQGNGQSEEYSGFGYAKQSVVTGTIIVVPVLLTAFVLLLVLGFLENLLSPIIIPLHRLLGEPGEPGLFTTLLAAGLLGGFIAFVGVLAESGYTENLEQYVDEAMARVPGVSTVHGTLNQLSEIIVESDTDNFQEVVLVEYPAEGSYSVAFKTAEPPEVISQATAGEDMITVFMPFGPNPVMGGFVLYIAEDRVHDVDLSVEEGITSVVSFGVSIEDDDQPNGDFS
jgi:uncharacterized membrane protein